MVVFGEEDLTVLIESISTVLALGLSTLLNGVQRVYHVRSQNETRFYPD